MKTRKSKWKHQSPTSRVVSKSIAKDFQKLTAKQLEKIMKISSKLAIKTKNSFNSLTFERKNANPAIFMYCGSVYKHITPESYTREDMEFAQKHLRILSGLYGMLKPLDGIEQYRLEMKLVSQQWTKSISEQVEKEADTIMLNLASKEYSGIIKTKKRMISPIFISNGRQITIQTKIARGMMAEWVIKNKILNPNKIQEFDALGYSYDMKSSKKNGPVFIRST